LRSGRIGDHAHSPGGKRSDVVHRTCDVGDVGAADTANVTIVVKVKAPKGTKLTDAATASATTGDTIPGNDSKSAMVKIS
jgi:hypothetical protein